MASDDEAGPSEKQIKLDATDSVIDVHSMNKLFPKIDNLEHFPLKVLLNIFTRLDHMDLYNLAEKSARFEGIAKIVLNERYSHEYFIVDETVQSPYTYLEFFERFGNEIKALDARNTEEMIGGDDWITLFLDETKNLEKLTLVRFELSSDTFNVLQHVNKNITHLILRNCRSCNDISPLSEFGNLKRLGIQDWPVIKFDAMEEVFRNNPALESLILSEDFKLNSATIMGEKYQFGQLMEHIGKHLKQLKELEYTPISKTLVITRPPDHVINGFVSSLKHLESLALSSNVNLYTDYNGLLRRLNSECKSIKHLKLQDIDGEDTQVFDIIRLFERIESLTLVLNNYGQEIYSVVEHLPFLRDMEIAGFEEFVPWDFVILVIRNCPSLEKLTVVGDSEDPGIEIYGRNGFFWDFNHQIRNPNVKFQVKCNGRIIGCVTKDQVIWRNKLVHWVGYDPDRNASSVKLLDLANEPSDAVAANAEQTNPFDVIFGYLDLKSLHSFSQTSQKCLQLVERYVKQHQGTFAITNEFYSNHYGFNGYYDGFEMFAEYVIDLKLNIVNRNIDDFEKLLESFHNLKKLHIDAEAEIIPFPLIVPQIRHLIYDGYYSTYYCDLSEISNRCPELKTLELNQGFYKEGDRLEFRNLKTCILKYHVEDQYQVENLEKAFEGTNTKVFLRICCEKESTEYFPKLR